MTNNNITPAAFTLTVGELHLPDSYKARWEAELAAAQADLPNTTPERLVAWALRFYLDRAAKMRAEAEAPAEDEEPSMDAEDF
jgi:hypothetical protein